MGEVECGDDLGEVIEGKGDYGEGEKGLFGKGYYEVFEEKVGFVGNVSVIEVVLNMGGERLVVVGEWVGGVGVGVGVGESGGGGVG